MRQSKMLNHIIFEVIQNKRVAELNCNGNIFRVELGSEPNTINLYNPLGTCIGTDTYELWRHMNNTVVDSLEFFDNYKCV